MKVLPKTKNFLGIDKKYSDYENSRIVILSAPYEKTVSYGKGTKNGPKEILRASHYVEFYDEEIKRELCFEKGIATLPQLNLTDLKSRKALDKIYKSVKANITNGKFVVTLGGEHTISQATIKAHWEAYENLSVLQFDAHSDLRDTYEGTKYSHACVMARVAEFTTDIVQIGIRAQDISEAEFIKVNKINTFYAYEIFNSKNWMTKALKLLKENVYITFDVDAFDPSLLPATGTPEPGGLFWNETMQFLKLVGKERNIIGFDVVELAPSKAHPASNFIAAKLVYKILNFAFM